MYQFRCLSNLKIANFITKIIYNINGSKKVFVRICSIVSNKRKRNVQK